MDWTTALRTTLLAALFLGAAARSVAGTTGVLTGYVLDAKTTAPIPGADVFVFLDNQPVPNTFLGYAMYFMAPSESDVAAAHFRGFRLNELLVSFPHCPPIAVVHADQTTSLNLYLAHPMDQPATVQPSVQPTCLPTVRPAEPTAGV